MIPHENRAGVVADPMIQNRTTTPGSQNAGRTENCIGSATRDATDEPLSLDDAPEIAPDYNPVLYLPPKRLCLDPREEPALLGHRIAEGIYA